VRLTSACFADQQRIPSENAFGVADPQIHATFAANRNPDLSWSGLPSGTRSLVLICHDYDVPSRADDVNQEGRTIPADLPRVDFFHWVLVDLPADSLPIYKAEFSDGVTPRGKPGPAGPRGTRQGLNDYTRWFTGDKDMEGQYFGYDGPCPPWNDSIVHHYVFTLYALDVPRCPVDGVFTGADVRRAIEGHVLDKATLTGLYSINSHVQA
jgi:Raf kinase inhibitor-like YbhB/YbcL family protein